jgi:hypothetical protein
MIKILVSLFGEKISIAIEDGEISIKSKNKDIVELIKFIYSKLLESYGPSDGSFGGAIAQELVAIGAKIIEVKEPPVEEGRVY